MKSVSPMFRALFGALACACAASAVLPAVAHADTLASEPAMRRTIYVPRDKSLSFRLGQPASRIVVAQPEIAKITGTSDRTFYVQGIEFGSTNLLIYGPGGRLDEVIDIRVGYDANGLQDDLAAAFPGEPLQVRNLGESLLLTGDVSSTGVQEKAEKLAERYAPESVISRLTVRESQQVILEVRIVEADRTVLKDVGVDLNFFNSSFAVATGAGLIGITPPHGVFATHGGAGPVNIDTALQVLEEKHLVRTLARPNIVAISGKKASFLAGGEFPYPVPQELDKIVIEFRQYGVKLDFTPTLRDNGWIQMAVEPEVSELDYTNAVTIRDITVPALIVRRASTTLELKPGDTFVMAGLFQRGYRNTVQQTPGLGNLPILGALFRSAQWKRNETELMIIVTPRLATAADRAVTPIDAIPGGREPSDVDLLLFGKSHDRKIEREPEPAPVAR
jgi:pilus assembly protein CpaC